MTQELWEILVPTQHSNGRPIRTRHHRVWDAKVRAITGGLTILTPTKGQWMHREDGNKLYEERMIPVRIACTRDQLGEVLKITKAYYAQIQIMAIKISSEVIFYE